MTSGFSPCFQIHFRHAWGQNPVYNNSHSSALVGLNLSFSASQKNKGVTPEGVLSFFIDSEAESSFSQRLVYIIGGHIIGNGTKSAHPHIFN